MGWRVTSPSYYVAPGSVIRMAFWWNKPGDKGAQWAMAHPMAGEPSSALVTERVAKRVDCEIGVIIINGPPSTGVGTQGPPTGATTWTSRTTGQRKRIDPDGGPVDRCEPCHTVPAVGHRAAGLRGRLRALGHGERRAPQRVAPAGRARTGPPAR